MGSPTTEDPPPPTEMRDVVERERAEARRNCSALMVGELDRWSRSADEVDALTLSGGRVL